MNALKSFSVIKLGKGNFSSISFLLGFIVRSVPEMLSYPYPIGFDTIYYAWRVKEGIIWYPWASVFSTWLLYAILIPIYEVLKVDVFLLLKLIAPLLFGLNTFGIYYFAHKALGWEKRKSLFATLFFSFQIATLSISWTYYRNMIGLGILLFALTLVHGNLKTMKEFVLFALLSVFVVFSHELVSVTLFVVVLGIAAGEVAMKRMKMRTLKILMAISPAFAVVLIGVYFVIFPVPLPIQENVIAVYQSVGHYEGPFFFFTNYLTVHDSVQHYPTYLDLASHVFSLFSLFYIVVLPLVLVGFFRDKVLDCWSILLLVGSFGALITPFFALNVWHRWMRMLVYPFTFYAVNGITRVLYSCGGSVSPAFRWLSWMRLSKKVVKLILAISISFSLIFMGTPLFFGRSGVFGFPTTVSYLPSSMLSNTVPLLDVDDVVNAMKWLNEKMDDGSVLLAQNALFYWARLHMDEVHTLVYFEDEIEKAIEAALQRGFSDIYFVWWNENIGWYGLSVPNEFVSVFSSGRISVFKLSRGA